VLNSQSGSIESYDETQPLTGATPLATVLVGGGSGSSGIAGLASDLGTGNLFAIPGKTGSNSFLALGLPLGSPALSYSPLPLMVQSVSAQAGLFFTTSNTTVSWYSQSTGALVSSLNIPGAALADAQLEPVAGELYVLARAATTILVYDFASLALKRSGIPNPAISNPVAMAVDPVNHELYVTDDIKPGASNSSVYRFSTSWTGTGATLAPDASAAIDRPLGISLDLLGGVVRIGGVDCSNDKVYFLPLDLSSSTVFSNSGFGTTCSRGPQGIALCN
jgi:hypothetical protein